MGCGHQLTRHQEDSSLQRRDDRSEVESERTEGGGGTRLMFSGEGGRAATGHKQGCANGSQAAVQTGRDLLLLPAGDDAADAT